MHCKKSFSTRPGAVQSRSAMSTRVSSIDALLEMAAQRIGDAPAHVQPDIPEHLLGDDDVSQAAQAAPPEEDPYDSMTLEDLHEFDPTEKDVKSVSYMPARMLKREYTQYCLHGVLVPKHNSQVGGTGSGDNESSRHLLRRPSLAAMPPRQFEVEEIPVPRASLPHYFPHYLLITPSADSRHHSLLSLSRPLNARTLRFRPVSRTGPSRTPLDCLRD